MQKDCSCWHPQQLWWSSGWGEPLVSGSSETVQYFISTQDIHHTLWRIGDPPHGHSPHRIEQLGDWIYTLALNTLGDMCQLNIFLVSNTFRYNQGIYVSWGVSVRPSRQGWGTCIFNRLKGSKALKMGVECLKRPKAPFRVPGSPLIVQSKQFQSTLCSELS